MLNEFWFIYIRWTVGSYNHNYSGECITSTATKLSNAKSCIKK